MITLKKKFYPSTCSFKKKNILIMGLELGSKIMDACQTTGTIHTYTRDKNVK